MASLTWLDLDGKRHKSEEFSDIKSFRSYIRENGEDIKVVELLDGDPLESLFDESTISGLFEGCINLVEVKDVIGTSKVKDMCCMFTRCDDLESVPYFDTSNVKDMCYMFSCCSSLESVPLLDTSNVEDMDSMFWNCISLKFYTLPCDEYDTRSMAAKLYKSEKMLKGLNKLWQK